MVNLGCVLYKEGQYEAARQKFTDAMSVLGAKVKGQEHGFCMCTCNSIHCRTLGNMSCMCQAC